MNRAATTFVMLLCLLFCRSAMASDIFVIGRLVANEPISDVKDECPDSHTCFSWWKVVIQVEKTVQGKQLSGQVTAAVRQRSPVSERFKRALRLFVLAPIEDPDRRAELRADYYSEEASAPHQMFCLSQDPKELGLNLQQTYVQEDAKIYCFELPGVGPEVGGH